MAKNQTTEAVKQPNALSAYTPEQSEELIRCIDDPIYFIKKFVRIQHPTKGAVPFNLFPYQERMINAFHKYRFVCALTARQMGKCSTSETIINTQGTPTQIGKLIKTSIKQRVIEYLERLLIKFSK